MSKILVIEDETAVRENIIELLSEEGYQAIGATDGEEGVRLVWEELPDLIICDILMPKMDGYGVLARISRESRLANIPFIFLTARIGRDEMRTGMTMGADDYIPKPFTRNELLQAISTRLGRLQKLEAVAEKKLTDLRNNITYSLPHELMTPLSVVLGFSELLVDQVDRMDRAAIRNMAIDIRQSSKRILHLIQNYLLFAEIDILLSHPERSRPHYYDAQPLDAKALIHEIAENVAYTNGRPADLVIDAQEGLIEISESHFGKMIEEVLDNAFKFSLTGSMVTVEGHLAADSDYYQMRIVDRGRGMTAEQIRSIDGFIQFDRHLYEQQGLGLGLFLVKQLCRMYKGSFKVASIPGKETQIDILLPGKKK
jgi:two-component system sensor histidine kinase/response regulator